MRKLILLAAILASSAMLAAEPAAAASKSNINQVVGACHRTKGCSFTNDGHGYGTGCSPSGCFICVKGHCTQDAKGHPQGGKGVTIGGVSIPPGKVAARNGQTGNSLRRPVTEGSSLKPIVNSGVRMRGAGSQTNHGGRHH